MRFKKGDKAVLDLHTKMGHYGIATLSHGNIVTVSCVHSGGEYSVQDGIWVWLVREIMLKSIMEENGQMLFSFMLAD